LTKGSTLTTHKLKIEVAAQHAPEGGGKTVSEKVSRIGDKTTGGFGVENVGKGRKPSPRRREMVCKQLQKPKEQTVKTWQTAKQWSTQSRRNRTRTSKLCGY